MYNTQEHNKCPCTQR